MTAGLDTRESRLGVPSGRLPGASTRLRPTEMVGGPQRSPNATFLHTSWSRSAFAPFSLARSVSTYVCQACGARTRQFFGRCASCGQWNTLVEQVEAPTDSRRRRPVPKADPEAGPGRPHRSEPMAAVGDRPLQRLASGYGELDRVLGGGLVAQNCLPVASFTLTNRPIFPGTNASQNAL